MTPEERLSKYVVLPTEYVYVHKNNVKRLDEGELAFAYIEPEGNSKEYERVKSAAFLPSYKIDNNKYEVVSIKE